MKQTVKEDKTMMMELSQSDPLLKKTLWTGRIASEAGERLAILKSVKQELNNRYLFELKEPSKVQLSSVMKRLVQATRPFSLTATATPGLAILLSGRVIHGWSANLILFFLSFFSVILLQASVNIFNDVHDHLRGIDLPGDLGGSGAIQNGWFSARGLYGFGCALLFASGLLAVLPLYHFWRAVYGIALIGLIGGIGYSGFGIGFKYRALGDFVVFILCGPALCFGFSLVAFHQFSESTFFLGCVFGLAALGILHANNLNDIEVDQKRGARTVANQIGFKRSQKYFLFIYVAIFGLCAASIAFLKVPIWFGLSPLLTSVLVKKVVNQVKIASGPFSPIISQIRFEAAQIHLWIGMSFIFSILVAGVFGIILGRQ